MTPQKLDFQKGGGILPAIIQDAASGRVLMLGYMNQEAFDKTRETGMVTFYSRSRQKLWQKGEESGNVLKMVSIDMDCDADTLLVLATPTGPVCHRGTATCFVPSEDVDLSFIADLQTLIDSRKTEMPEGSYTTHLFNSGIKKIAQKVGEEAVELVLEAQDNRDDLFLNEAADLLYHYLVLLSAKNKSIHDIARVLSQRHLARKK